MSALKRRRGDTGRDRDLKIPKGRQMHWDKRRWARCALEDPHLTYVPVWHLV